jgi:shikimate kinase
LTNTDPPAAGPVGPAGPISFVGMAGVGKSSVAARVAGRLQRPFVDLDHRIVDLAGAPIEEIFRTVGETGFREAERASLLAVLDDPNRPVVATGGGVVIRSDNRADLSARSCCVWLDASRDELIARLSFSPGRRPLIGADIPASVDRLIGERTGWYQEVAAVRIDTTGVTVNEVVDRVLSALA